MRLVSNEQALSALNWRYAVKKFDATKKIAPADWATLEKTLVLTPSSFGLQPWKFFVVDTPALRQKLVPASWGQSQIADASHLVVFAVPDKITTADVDRLINRIASVRKVDAATLDPYKGMMTGFVQNPPPGFDPRVWAAKQAYIALGNFMTTAAVLGIDTCPMEGFNAAQYNEILGLTAKGYSASVVCVAGFRAADDKYQHAPKVRYDVAEVITHL